MSVSRIGKTFHRIAWTLLFLASAIPAKSAIEPAPTGANEIPLTGDLVQFFDGSMLHGRVQVIDTNKGVGWEHPEALQPIFFQPTNIESIRFDNSRATSGTNRAQCRFRFKNGDEFYGRLISLDEEGASIETWFQKKMMASRASLESITFLSKSFNLLYEGPNGTEGWNFGRGTQAWKYQDGALISTGVGTVGRHFGLPPSCSFEFDLAWTGPSFEMVIPFYTDSIDRYDYGTSSYMFHLRPNSVYLQRVHSEMGIVNLGRGAANVPNPRKKNSMHVEIRANKEDSTLAFLVDGVLVQKWKDDSGFSAKGTGVVFFSQHEGPSVKISNIKLSEWDGRFEDERPSDMKTDQDVVRLVNRDKVTGALGALREGKVAMTAAGTNLEIPFARVSQIVFKSGPTNAVSNEPWEVRAAFAAGEKISFKLATWNEREVTGVSRHLGKLSFDPKSIRQLQFNLSERKPTEENVSDEWDGDREVALISDKEDAVLFRNGDFLNGAMKSFEPGKQLAWERADAGPILFKTDRLEEIRFRQQQTIEATNDCRVTLSNGDEIEGRLSEITSDKIVLETSFAGKLSFARKRVMMLSPLQANRTLVFSGPTSLEGWTMGKVNAVPDSGEWQYKNGAFYATKAASVARDLNLPEKAIIHFDLAWKGGLQAAIALYTSHLQPVNLATKDTDADFGGFYSLQVNNITAGLMMVKKDVPLKYLWQLPVPAFSQKNSAHLEIRVDKKKRTIMFLVDGVVVKHAFDTDEFAGSGTCMRFVHQGQGSLKLSNLRVTEWDGFIVDRPTNFKGTEDLTKFRNGDKLVGKAKKYKDGKVTIASENSDLEIPIERIRQLELAGKSMEVPPRDLTEVVGYFKTGELMNFHIEGWDAKGIQARSGNFGSAVLNPTAFSRIRFKSPDDPVLPSVPGSIIAPTP